MVRYELKKILGSAGGKIALFLYTATVVLACWQSGIGANQEVRWVNEQGDHEYGLAAVKKLQAAQREWEGWLDQEKLNQVVQENQRILATPQAQSDSIQQRNIAYSWKQGFIPIRNLIIYSYATGFRSIDPYIADRITAIDEETFYANRARLLKEWLYDKTDTAYSKYSEPEKQYIIQKYEELKTPFYFAYHQGWYQLLENAAVIPEVGILILSFLLAGIFSNEFKWKSDAVYFSSKYGRSKATAAKIKAGFLLVTVLYWGAMGIYSLFTLCYLGFGGGNCVIQWAQWRSIYSLNLWQTWVLTVLSGYIGSLFLAFLVMWISVKTKSAVFAVTVPFILIFLPSFLEGIADWLDTLLDLMPARLLECYFHLKKISVLTIFGKVYRTFDICILLYTIASLVLAPMMYRDFRHKQIF